MDSGGVSFFFLPELAWHNDDEAIRNNSKKPANLLVFIVGTWFRESASFLAQFAVQGNPCPAVEIIGKTPT